MEYVSALPIGLFLSQHNTCAIRDREKDLWLYFDDAGPSAGGPPRKLEGDPLPLCCSTPAQPLAPGIVPGLAPVAFCLHGGISAVEEFSKFCQGTRQEFRRLCHLAILYPDIDGYIHSRGDSCQIEILDGSSEGERKSVTSLGTQLQTAALHVDGVPVLAEVTPDIDFQPPKKKKNNAKTPPAPVVPRAPRRATLVGHVLRCLQDGRINAISRPSIVRAVSQLSLSLASSPSQKARAFVLENLATKKNSEIVDAVVTMEGSQQALIIDAKSPVAVDKGLLHFQIEAERWFADIATTANKVLDGRFASMFSDGFACLLDSASGAVTSNRVGGDLLPSMDELDTAGAEDIPGGSVVGPGGTDGGADGGKDPSGGTGGKVDHGKKKSNTQDKEKKADPPGGVAGGLGTMKKTAQAGGKKKKLVLHDSDSEDLLNNSPPMKQHQQQQTVQPNKKPANSFEKAKNKKGDTAAKPKDTAAKGGQSSRPPHASAAPAGPAASAASGAATPTVSSTSAVNSTSMKQQTAHPNKKSAKPFEKAKKGDAYVFSQSHLRPIFTHLSMHP